MTRGISGAILAGGLGRRMGGLDKGLQRLQGRPLVEWVAERLGPQVDEMLLNANRNAVIYRQLGFSVVPDRIEGFAGPLAGLHAALSAATHPLVVTVPCDSPFFPGDLVARLLDALEEGARDLAIARTPDRLHPVFCLCRRSLLPGLADFLNSGERRVQAWCGRVNAVEVMFADGDGAFENINTPDQLEARQLPDGEGGAGKSGGMV